MSTLSTQFEHSGELSESDHLYRIRHSLAHVMAQAVCSLRPGTTLGFGPPIRDGFYYDFILPEPLNEDDFPEIERRMRKILKQGKRFVREELPVSEALARIDEMGEPYKREYAKELIGKQNLTSLSFFRNGDFLDMCEGPHVENSKEIKRDAFKLKSIAGAYWRGDSDNVMMTRIYAWAFASSEELNVHVERWEEAQQRDHKKLGRELDIFAIDPLVGRGLPLWLPNGTVIRDEIQKLAEAMEFQAGYQRVVTPHLARADLYRASGHLPYYQDDMYPLMELAKEAEGEGESVGGTIKETYVLRPMNCPHHHRIFAARPKSYRDLPVRLSEYGQVYRYEESGAVSGLLRVRAMCMNDAHIYCTEEQIAGEFKAVMAMYEKAYKILGINNYTVRLSRWDPMDKKRQDKYVDDPKAWEKSEATLRQVLIDLGINFVEGVGEAAFYGPKIDIQIETITGRDETLSTVQLDFSVPGRLGLVYRGADGKDHTPYCIHRAPFSTHERMVAFLLEHYGGAFPTWLAPIQVHIITVSEKYDDYGQYLLKYFKAAFVRCEMAASADRVPHKIRAALTRKIPNILVVGEQEAADQSVTLRRYDGKVQARLPAGEFLYLLRAAISKRNDASLRQRTTE